MANTAFAATVPNRVGIIVRSLLLLIARLALAAILMTHAWWRWNIAGISAQIGVLRDYHVPLATVIAYGAVVFEAMAGALLVLGLFTRIVSALVIVEQGLIIALIKWPSGIFLAQGGFEYNAAIATLGVVFCAVGTHFTGFDTLLARRRRARGAEELYQPALSPSQL